MSRLKVFALFLALFSLGLAPSAKAQVNCDPAVMTAMKSQAQTGFNEMSRLTTAFLKAPVPVLASICNQLVNSVWNPQRFAEEALAMIPASILGPQTYAWGSTPSFSLSFNPINVLLSTITQNFINATSLNFICTDAFDGIGNALRAVNYDYDPVTGQVKMGLGASIKAKGPVKSGLLKGFDGFMAGATIKFDTNPDQVDPN